MYNHDSSTGQLPNTVPLLSLFGVGALTRLYIVLTTEHFLRTYPLLAHINDLVSKRNEATGYC